MTPESVGLNRSQLVLGKLSGRAALKDKLKHLGYDLSEEKLAEAFAKFKALADRKKQVFDEDLIALVDTTLAGEALGGVQFVSLHVVCGSVEPPRVTLRLRIMGEEREAVTSGSGPVDATFNAIKALVPHEAVLQLFQVHAVTRGTDAQAEVTVRLDDNGLTAQGQGADTDTLVAAAMAYVQAWNKLVLKRGRVL
jgi:2-isopropylmalate synthase